MLSLCSLSSVLWKLRNQKKTGKKIHTHTHRHTHTHTYIYIFILPYVLSLLMVIYIYIYISVSNTTQFTVGISQGLVQPGRDDLGDLMLGHRTV